MDRRAKHWLDYLVSFIQGSFDRCDDATADEVREFESETRAAIRREIQSLGIQRCSLDHLAFKVYRTVVLRTTNDDENEATDTGESSPQFPPEHFFETI